MAKVKTITAWMTLGLLGLAMLLGERAQAADSPQVVIQARSGLHAGALKDGQLIAQGQVVFPETHQGFRVWSEGASMGQPHRFRLLSARGKPLDIRLVGKGWVPDNTTGQGIVNRTTAFSQPFDVEVDGGQTLPVDNWTLKFYAVVLLP